MNGVWGGIEKRGAWLSALSSASGGAKRADQLRESINTASGLADWDVQYYERFP